MSKLPHEQLGFYSKDIIKTSNKDDWETPQKLFEELDKKYFFTLDPCATPNNAKCENFLTREDNGLTTDWGYNIVFMNPPYGRDIKLWVRKAYEESRNKCLVVCLIPARTDTSYWHDYIFPYAEIEFLRGRLNFEVNGVAKDRAPFPSAIVIFQKREDA